MNYTELASKILEKIGGAENVNDVVHCMTRLRFDLKDFDLIDDEGLKKTRGIVGTVKKSGQYQVIIGNEVAYVYKELCKLGNFTVKKDKKLKNKKDQGVIAMLMDTISSIMAPVIPAIIGAAMLKVLLTILTMANLIDTTGETYAVLNVIGDGAFFFMPVLIAMSAANKFNTNAYYAVSIALVLLHPGFINLMDMAKSSGENIHFLSIIPVVTNNYSYSVIPIILGVWALSYVEPLVDKITPAMTKNFLKPLLVMLIIMPITIIILGPLGAIFGDLLSKIIYKFYDIFGFFAVGIIAGVYPFIVMAGMHHAFTPIKLGVLATVGYEAFICIGELASNLAQGGAALAVAVKSKNKDFKQIAGSSAFSAIVAGITEPALYGVNVRLKKPMIGACCGAIAGGLFGGIMQMKCFGIATPSFITIVQYVEKNRASSIFIALGAMLIAVIVSFIATYLIGFEDIVYEDEEERILERAESLDKTNL